MYFITFINYIILIGFLVGRRVFFLSLFFFFIPIKNIFIGRNGGRKETQNGLEEKRKSMILPLETIILQLRGSISEKHSGL